MISQICNFQFDDIFSSG
uniref:Uncharacterized protein n=1 Tax=Rhizophora mucronata TaxID=61149 RepID=A0A2P2Q686_RHIMU